MSKMSEQHTELEKNGMAPVEDRTLAEEKPINPLDRKFSEDPYMNAMLIILEEMSGFPDRSPDVIRIK
jgi:hypothetical protein